MIERGLLGIPRELRRKPETNCSSFNFQGSSEEVKLVIHQLTESASRLLIDCKKINHHDNTPDQLTQRIIQGAYDVAKATKQLVTIFQH